MPEFMAGRGSAVALGAMQVGTLFMANDWLVIGRHDGELGALLSAAAYPLLFTLLLAWNLGTTATERGYVRAWGLFSGLSLIGVAVVYCLPDRTLRHVPGFPIEPSKRQP